MRKIYKVYANMKYLFDGNDETFVLVKKETKDKIFGLEIENFRGNYGLIFSNGHTEPPITGEEIVIIKNNVAGWKRCRDANVATGEGGEDE